MTSMPLQTIIEKIKEKSQLSDDEIHEKIKQKMTQLAGLISEEGAAHIVANDLGIRLVQASGAMKIKDLVAGMRNIELNARVAKKYALREFQKGEIQGKVASFLAADETGQLRIVLWHALTKDFDVLKENDVVKILSGYIKESNGFKELHLNEKSKLFLNPPNVAVAQLSQQMQSQQQKQYDSTRKRIHDLKENETNIELVGTIVQVFDIKFFEICPNCGKKVSAKETGFVCNEHGAVKHGYSYVVNVFLDDGTDNIRAVFFKNQVKKLLKKEEEEILIFKEAPEAFAKIKNDLLGEMIKIVGKTSKNMMFDRLEFISNFVFTDINPEDEMKKLEKELQTAPNAPNNIPSLANL
ncbi:hypothetical protein HZA96_04010 [Candidatus Woesearchaeota archaeon]|nr:hypothetical protein [Candidatus Woesearchaeota archaeon]